MPSISFYIITLATFISLFFYKKLKNTKNIYFIYYLVFSFITYLIGFIFKSVLEINDFPVYNTYVILSFLFYIYFYKKLFKNKRNKKIMNLFLILFLVFTIVDILVLKTDYYNDFIINSTIFVALLLIITLILFLAEIINNERIIFFIKKSFIFWISAGSLLFFVGIIPIIVTASFLNFDGIFDTMLAGLNLVMYGSVILGFTFFDKKYDY